ncbi:MAG: M50 family metallopeptidase [Candidatus Sulfotelmatobacter sp.]
MPMQDLPETAPDTPILDSGVLPPVRRTKRAVGVIIGFVVGIVFAAVINNVGSLGPHPGLALLFYFTILGLVVTVHELGHLAAGWIVGFHFSRVSIGPVTLKIQYGKLNVQLRRDLGALGYAGMHIETVKKARRSLLTFVAAGPGANLLSGTLAVLFVYFATPTLSDGWVLPFAAGFSALSFITAVLSVIPYGQSDGARLWMLLNSREGTRRWIASCALGSQQRKGIRPKNWKQSWMKAACSIRDGRFDELNSNLLAYVAASDRKDGDAAALHLERSLDLSRSPDFVRRDFLAREACYLCAWFRDDLSLAERWLSQIRRPKLTTQLLQIRTSIALDCARRKFDNALAGCKKGAEFIAQLPDSKVKRLLQDSWREWTEEIQERQNQMMTAQV